MIADYTRNILVPFISLSDWGKWCKFHLVKLFRLLGILILMQELRGLNVILHWYELFSLLGLNCRRWEMKHEILSCGKDVQESLGKSLLWFYCTVVDFLSFGDLIPFYLLYSSLWSQYVVWLCALFLYCLLWASHPLTFTTSSFSVLPQM
jgi:hypothetical protein